MIDKKCLEYIFNELEQIHEGILDESYRTKAAFRLGVLTCYIDLWIQEIEEKRQKDEDFGHT